MNDMVTEVRGWLDAAQAMQADTVALRRAIHAEPELGLQTPKTLAKVRAALAGLPLEWKTGPSTTGAVAVLRGAKPGPHGAAARRHGRAADARGHRPAVRVRGRRHDARLRPRRAHRDAGLGARAAVRAARSLAGAVLFMFQPGEEGFTAPGS